MTGSIGSSANEQLHGPPKHIDKDRHWVDEHTVVETQQDLDLKIDFLVWRHWLSNGDSFIRGSRSRSFRKAPIWQLSLCFLPASLRFWREAAGPSSLPGVLRRPF